MRVIADCGPIGLRAAAIVARIVVGSIGAFAQRLAGQQSRAAR